MRHERGSLEGINACLFCNIACIFYGVSWGDCMLKTQRVGRSASRLQCLVPGSQPNSHFMEVSR
jgi:hypothetical protein